MFATRLYCMRKAGFETEAELSAHPVTNPVQVSIPHQPWPSSPHRCSESTSGQVIADLKPASPGGTVHGTDALPPARLQQRRQESHQLLRRPLLPELGMRDHGLSPFPSLRPRISDLLCHLWLHAGQHLQ